VALSEILGQLRGQKTIVWSMFRATYSRIASTALKLGRSVAFLTGEQTAKEKEQAIEDFCRGSVDTLVANPAAGGVGVNLTEAKYSVYYTLGYSLEQYIQSEARNFRAGSMMHDKVTHYHMVTPGTLDEAIHDALMKKKSVAETVEQWARKYSLDAIKRQE
jgi:SNF2 family DNA or RNA helicase